MEKEFYMLLLEHAASQRSHRVLSLSGLHAMPRACCMVRQTTGTIGALRYAIQSVAGMDQDAAHNESLESRK
jgi:hypothetical protein